MRACIEGVLPDQVRGWAYHEASPSDRLVVSLLVDDQVIGETRAANFREDLKENGLGDGCYGYLFDDFSIETLPAAYLAGRVHVVARSESTAALEPAAAAPAPYLRQQVEDFLHAQLLENCRFADFLVRISAAQSDRAGDPGSLLDIVNSSRAHFPEWASSKEFLILAAALARAASRPHTQRFYESYGESTVGLPASAEPLPTTYGSLEDWLAANDTASNLEIIAPRFFRGGHASSFLEEVGILKDGPQSTATVPVPVLAFREYAWGEATWWVNRHGERTPVARSLYYLDFELLRSVLDRGGCLLIDMSNEAVPARAEWMDVLNRALAELMVNPGQVIFVTQNLRFGMGSSDIAFRGRVMVAHYFISKSIDVLRRRFPDEAECARHCSAILAERAGTPDASLKHYVCLNFTPRWSRWAMVLHLSLNGLLDRGYVSFPGRTHYKMQGMVDIETVLPNLKQRRELLLHVPAFIERCPLELDTPFSGDSPDFVYPIPLTTSSLLHVVTESEMTDGENLVRVTEKILKPIVGLQPFIVAGNPGSLELLRRMGFQTFGSIIDERYDTIADPARRLDAVFAEIDRLVHLPVGSLRALVEQAQDAALHNFLHLMNVAPLLFNQAVNHRLRRLIGTRVVQTLDGASPDGASPDGVARRLRDLRVP